MSKSLEFYQLERAPFEDGVRDAAAVGTRPLRAALERARRFIETETAVVCVTGRPGIGKTYFGLALPSVLPAATLLARIGQPAQSWSALHAAIAKGFDLDPHGFSVDALHDLRDTDRRLVIEIDAVEQLQLDAFTPLLSLLSHAYLPERRLVQAVLIGDFARLPEAAREGLAQLGSATLELEALPDSDVPSYVQKRLDRAGYRGQPLFTRAACEEIRRRAEGLPREINRICSAALDLAAARRAGSIAPELIGEACEALPAVPRPAPAPAQEELAPPAAAGAAAPRAVIGRLKLETRVQPARATPLPAAPASGQVRRIEPLPPEPVVQAEPETPLMDAVFVDDEEPSSPPPSLPPRPVPIPESAPVRPTSASVEARPVPVAVAVAVETVSDPTFSPAVVAPAAAGPVQPVAAAPATAAPDGRDAPPAPARRRRAFPWVHVAVSLAASWVVAGGVFWVYTQRERPATPTAALETPRKVEPSISLEATSIAPEPGAEPLARAEIAPPVAPTAPVPAEAPVQTAGATHTPEAPPASSPSPPAPAPAETTSPAPAPAPPASRPPVQTAAASPAAAPVPAAGPRKAAPAPAPPLRVELRARGREVLYPPRPASAYVTPER
jgi:type II secretory pathway predicted ATPase ExeA